MENIINSALDFYKISESLGEIEWYMYDENLLKMVHFSSYEELFSEIAAGAGDLRERVQSLYQRGWWLGDKKASSFDAVARLLNYSFMDYLRTTDNFITQEAIQDKEADMASLEEYSKKDQRQHIINIFDFMVEFQRLEMVYKILFNILERFENHNSGMEEAVAGGAE